MITPDDRITVTLSYPVPRIATVAGPLESVSVQPSLPVFAPPLAALDTQPLNTFLIG